MEMNILLEKDRCRMFLFKGGKVYLLVKHHRYLDPEDAYKMLIGPGTPQGLKGLNIRQSNRNQYDRIVYLTDKI